ncbi:unnamed protein product [Thlaspi arvense]|uniref:Putative gamma-glutamylcyclotransferase n=1 Tax=Thlaspi arvense TaxID=13288 RepID=A0AAU9RLP0_THLAR|nr:unnamed protein product [Thlaspi arvense]
MVASMASSDQSPSHNVFVYGTFQEPAVVDLILECTPVTLSAQLHGFHLYKVKGRLYPCISPSKKGVINGKILTGLTDAQLQNLDMIEGAEYVRKTVEVVLTDTWEKMKVEAFIWANKDDPDLYGEWDFEDTWEKMKVEAFIWTNKDDPDLYGEWDFEEWKQLHMEKFIEASKKFMEWKKNPNGRSRQDHVYRVKGRLHSCISPSENGVINGKVLTGLTDAQLENLDMIEGDEYVRTTVEVVLTDTSEKMQVETFIWANKDDPDLYGEWDFEEWKRLHMEKFIEASKQFIEWKKNPNGRTREEFAKFVNEDPPAA